MIWWRTTISYGYTLSLLWHLLDIPGFVLSQVLPYDMLMQELDVTNVRELEDFLINECMYVVGTTSLFSHQMQCYI